VVAGRARDLREGMDLARHSIDSGAALRKLDELVRFTMAIPAKTAEAPAGGG
jgi:anthranilate phosphoribosyltransferase